MLYLDTNIFDKKEGRQEDIQGMRSLVTKSENTILSITHYAFSMDLPLEKGVVFDNILIAQKTGQKEKNKQKMLHVGRERNQKGT